MDNTPHFSDNLANWNDRVPIHAGPDGYGIEAFASDPERLSSIVAFDKDHVGDVSGRSLLHLQCHIGTDTLSWAKLGADVTGVDFSAPALDVARRLASDLGLDATFVESGVYESPTTIDRRFDIVYTGVGALCWLPDIRRWAAVVAGFTKPGGTFYIREGHPILWSVDDERDDASLVIAHPYFEHEEPTTWDLDETYAGTGKLTHTVSHEWNHGLGEIVSALIDEGFRIDRLDEHRFLDWQAFPSMIRDGDVWRLPEAQQGSMPLMYSILATRR